MIVLAIDTSSPDGSVSLALDATDAESMDFGGTHSHLVGLSRSVDSLLARHRLRLDDVDRLALVSGPGSFTGLRIGMSLVKGIHAALGTDVVTMNTLELLARPFLERHPLVCPMIDARKGEIYTALYRRVHRGKRMLEAVLSLRAVAPLSFLKMLGQNPVLFVGSGAVAYRELIETTTALEASFAGGGENVPSTRLFCALAEQLDPLEESEILVLEPLYIRPSDAELKRLRAHRSYGTD